MSRVQVGVDCTALKNFVNLPIAKKQGFSKSIWGEKAIAEPCGDCFGATR
jgi:hypothetical protein